MHAGLVNGGGILIVRFASLYVTHPTWLLVLAALGFLSAMLGTLWKLMQHDVKRMLACSTLGQMGFMVLQCGLGLFPAAVVHLCWHGCFKAYLFLSSGSILREKRVNLDYPPDAYRVWVGLVAGLIGSYSFATVSGSPLFVSDTTLVLHTVAFITTSQIAINVVPGFKHPTRALAVLLAGLAGVVYGFSVTGIELILAPLHLWQPQPLTPFHGVVVLGLLGSWLIMMIGPERTARIRSSKLGLWAYVRALNASQPAPSTVTANRNSYSY
jgi:NAD(P)H-quinone oxidoreductase subunit 5